MPGMPIEKTTTLHSIAIGANRPSLAAPERRWAGNGVGKSMTVSQHERWRAACHSSDQPRRTKPRTGISGANDSGVARDHLSWMQLCSLPLPALSSPAGTSAMKLVGNVGAAMLLAL